MYKEYLHLHLKKQGRKYTYTKKYNLYKLLGKSRSETVILHIPEALYQLLANAAGATQRSPQT